MDMTREISEQCQTKVDEDIDIQAIQDQYSNRWDEYLFVNMGE